MGNNPQFEKLFEPARIGQMELRNRIVMPPMVTRYASEGGYVTERISNYYGARAQGGVGLIIVEATYVHSRGQAFANQLGISDDRYIAGMRKLVQSIHKHGAKAALQLHHAGMQARPRITGMQPVAPSPVPKSMGLLDLVDEIPKELTAEEIAEIVSCFAQAAVRAKKAEFDGVEIHGAHSYLFAQFLSRAFNRRQDSYGGDLRNRARFLVDVIEVVRQAVGEAYPVWCRINGKEYGIEGGTTVEEGREIARLAQIAGADAIHVSGRCLFNIVCTSPAIWGPLPLESGMFIELAQGIRKMVSVPVIAVGRIAPEVGERLLERGEVDFIAMGRDLLADPEFPNKLASGRSGDITPCIVCMRCVDDLRIPTEAGIRCSVNATLGREGEHSITPSKEPKRVLVVGGGPAGMEAARVASLRGHQVTLYEKENRLGGQLVQAAIPPRKDGIAGLTRYLETQIKKLGVKVELGQELTAALVQELKPDAVIIATGAIPLTPDIPGMSKAQVVHAGDILENRVAVGDRVVVIGGELVGCETAEFLAEKGRKVTVTRRGPEMALGVGASLREQLLKRLDSRRVTLLTGVKYGQITPQGLMLTTKEGEKRTIEADTIVLAAGSSPNRKLFDELVGKVSEIHLVGDCVEARKIRDAIAEGFRAACEI